MAAYFSFRKLITPFFVRTIYTIGFALLTAGGVGWSRLGRDATYAATYRHAWLFATSRLA